MFTARYELNCTILRMKWNLSDFATETGFDPKSVHVRFVVEKAALKQASLRVLPYSLVGITLSSS